MLSSSLMACGSFKESIWSEDTDLGIINLQVINYTKNVSVRGKKWAENKTVESINIYGTKQFFREKEI